MIDYRPFHGDGREKRPLPFAGPALPGTRPIRVTNSQAREFIKSFMGGMAHQHSRQGGSLWVFIEYCQLHGIPYRLTAVPGKGYRIEKIDDPTEPSK